MNCIYPRLIRVPSTPMFPRGQNLTVPCGQCMACRIARRREWTVRLMHELSTSGYTGLFLTLTYAPEYVPENGSLQPYDLQNFWKRMRKKYNNLKIRYYAVGEYGDTNDRPHYHAIVFGIGIADVNAIDHHGKWISKDIEKLWSYGFNQVGTVTVESCQYVAGYIEKKLNGIMGQEEYDNKGRIAPFSRMSKGIGLDYLRLNDSQIIDNLKITMRGKNVGIPKYYKRKLNNYIDAETLYLATIDEEALEKKASLYAKAYQSGGEIATEKLRREIAAYREECIRARQKLFAKPLDQPDGPTGPPDRPRKGRN